MAPARHFFRVSRATTSGQTQYTKRGPAAIQKRTRASQADKSRFELFEDASAAFADFKNGLQYMQHQPCQEFEFTEGTPSFVRIGQVCKYRGYNDALLFPQLYVTSDGYKVAYCHVCNEDYSVTNYSKVKTRHSSSDEHLTQVAKLLRVDPNCLRNPYRCFVASCSYTVGGEREDTVLRHYKTAHLSLSPDQPIPNDIKMAIDNYKRAMQAAWSEGSDFTGYPVPSRLTTPESSPALATSLAYLSPSSTQRSASIVSSSSSVAPSTPIDDINQEWSAPSQALSPIDSELKLDAWFPDLDAEPCLSFPEPQPDLFPALGSPSSFPFEPTQSFLDSPFDFHSISLTDDMPLEFPELVDNASHSESPSWDFSQLENTPPSLVDFDFDFSQASGLDTEFDWGFDLSSFSS